MNCNGTTGVQRPGEVTQEYTQIPNRLLEAVIRYHSPGGEKDVLLAVLRHTYGFHRKECRLSISYVSRMTGRPNNKIGPILRSLIEKGVLVEVSAPSFNAPRIVRVNGNLEEWESPSRGAVPLQGGSTVPLEEGRTVPLQGDQEIKNKENSKKPLMTKKRKETEDQALWIFDHYKQKVRAGARTDAIRSIAKLLKTYPPEILLSCIDRYAGNGMNRDPTYRFQANNFFGRAEHFKDYLFDKNESVKRRFSPLQDDLQRQSDCQVTDSQNTKVIQ